MHRGRTSRLVLGTVTLVLLCSSWAVVSADGGGSGKKLVAGEIRENIFGSVMFGEAVVGT